MTDNSGQLKEAIEVLKKVKHWIDYGAGELEPTADNVIGAIDTVFSELGKPTYTADDIFDFIKWGFTKPGYMRNYFNYFSGDIKGFFTPSELLKKWEDWKAQQRGEGKPLKCIRCGKELDKDKIVLNSFGNKDNNPDVVFCSDCEHLNYIEHLQQGKEATE